MIIYHAAVQAELQQAAVGQLLPMPGLSEPSHHLLYLPNAPHTIVFNTSNFSSSTAVPRQPVSGQLMPTWPAAAKPQPSRTRTRPLLFPPHLRHVIVNGANFDD